MITPEEYAEALRDSDPEMAFCRLEHTFRTLFNQRIEHVDNNEAYDAAVIEYINHTIAAAHALGLQILDGWEVPTRGARGTMYDRMHDFMTAVDHFKVQVQVDNARSHRRYSVPLSVADKARIHGLVDQIKSIIETSSLAVAKKEQLLNKLNAFVAAVDRDRTGLETFSNSSISIMHAIGEGARELEPVRVLLDSISRLLGRARENEESTARLPKRNEPNKLPPPRRSLPPPKEDDPPSFGENDDIPF